MPTPFEQVLAPQNLFDAWRVVRRRRVAPGVDEETVDAFEREVNAHIETLRADLAACRFVPAPAREVLIPKPGKGDELRALALPTIRDKLVQQALRQVLEPLFEPQFLDCSYAYRADKGPGKAIQRVLHIVRDQPSRFAAKSDIDNFFDTIDHERLLELVGETVPDPDLLRLLKLFLQSGIIQATGAFVDQVSGVPTGASLSPLLSNIYLHPLDVYLRAKKYEHVRYADDWVILSRSRERVGEALAAAQDFLKGRLKLRLNPQRRNPFVVAEGFPFLGFIVKGERLLIDRDKLGRIQAELQRIGARAGFGSFERLVGRLLPAVNGWTRYYRRAADPEALARIENDIVAFVAFEAARRMQAGHLPKDWNPEALLARFEWPVGPPPATLQAIRQAMAGAERRLAEERAREAAEKSRDEKVARLARKEKRRYRTLHRARSEWVVWEAGSTIGAEAGRLIVRREGKKALERPAAQVSSILVKNRGVSVSAAALELCARNDVRVAFVGRDGTAYATLMAPENPDIDLHLAQLRLGQERGGLRIARAVVAAKLTNQRNLLRYFAKSLEPADAAGDALIAERMARLDEAGAAVRAVDTRACKAEGYAAVRDRLMGFEGVGGAAYWEGIAALVAEVAPFPGRRRQGANDVVNNLLNYGYGILYARMQALILKSGLHPQLSFLHKPERRKSTLSFDMVEEFRAPVVDRTVVAYLRRGRPAALHDGRLDDETRRLFTRAVLDRIHSETPSRHGPADYESIMRAQLDELRHAIENHKRYRPFIQRW